MRSARASELFKAPPGTASEQHKARWENPNAGSIDTRITSIEGSGPTPGDRVLTHEPVRGRPEAPTGHTARAAPREAQFVFWGVTRLWTVGAFRVVLPSGAWQGPAGPRGSGRREWGAEDGPWLFRPESGAGG